MKIIKRRGIVIILLLLIILILTKDSLALGVTPGRNTIDFTPNSKNTYSFKILNNDEKYFNAIIEVKGTLAEYITLHDEVIEFKDKDIEKEFTYEVNLPSKLEPGLNTAEIVITEVPKNIKEKGTFIGAVASVVLQIHVYVPYPGKYAKIDFKVPKAQVGETINFFIPVFSLGTEDIKKARVVIDILGPEKEKIVSLTTEEKTIKAKAKDEFITTWKADVYEGIYHAIAVLNYDGNIATIEQDFAVGESRLEILEITTQSNFRLGDIAKFNILVNSNWNKEIKEVYSNLIINDKSGKEIANVKSATDNILPFENKTLIAYWDTANVKEGVYDGKIILHYEEKTVERAIKSYISLTAIRTTILTGRAIAGGGVNKTSKINLVAFIIIILIITNIVWFIYYKKKKKYGKL